MMPGPGGWRTERQARAFVLGLSAVLVFLEIRDRQLQGSWRLPAAMALTAVLLGGLWLALRRASPGLLAGAGAVSAAMTALAPESAGAGLYWVVGTVAMRLPLRTGLPVALATSAANLAVLYAIRGPSVLGQLLLPAGSVALAYIGLYSVRQRRLQEDQARGLERESARAEERERLAREIHDVLAHSLSAMAVQLDLAGALLRQRPDDPAALAAVERARALARDGLQEARRAVSALRGDELPGPELLSRLAADFERDSGVGCRLEVPPRLPEMSSEQRVALYRTAQEALTNVRKHASARQVLLRLEVVAGGVELSVVNDGAHRPGGPAGGFGLTGMRERAELLGGRLEAGPLDGSGFRVWLWLPAA